MNLKIGIVGLPNVGKSTLFNALTNAGALAANYPFATIEPNVGIVPVPDERLDCLAEMYQTDKKVPATVEFVDIAGLVKGASKGEGLGNKFLAHIRECQAICHVVRAFKNGDIVRADNKPEDDIIKQARDQSQNRSQTQKRPRRRIYPLPHRQTGHLYVQRRRTRSPG